MTFIVSKLFWLFAAPGNALVLFLCVGTVLLFTRWHHTARWLITLVTAVALFISVVPVGQWLMVPLENRFAARPVLQDVEGIIVLGGGANPAFLPERSQVDLNEGGDRLVALVDLALRFPDAKVIYTGGSSSKNHPPIREPDGARWILTEMGFDATRVRFERDSNNTVQHVLNSKALVNSNLDGSWVLVTSAAHMPRAVGVFRKHGWPVTAYPVDYATSGRFVIVQAPNFTSGLILLSRGVKEWIGLAAYYWLGYTDSIFPGPSHDK